MPTLKVHECMPWQLLLFFFFFFFSIILLVRARPPTTTTTSTTKLAFWVALGNSGGAICCRAKQKHAESSDSTCTKKITRKPESSKVEGFLPSFRKM
jgi:hypothetical protein